jgi:hypothetical protein
VCAEEKLWGNLSGDGIIAASMPENKALYATKKIIFLSHFPP